MELKVPQGAFEAEVAGGILEAGEREGIEADEGTLEESSDCFDSNGGDDVELLYVREYGEEEGVSDDD